MMSSMCKVGGAAMLICILAPGKLQVFRAPARGVRTAQTARELARSAPGHANAPKTGAKSADSGAPQETAKGAVRATGSGSGSPPAQLIAELAEYATAHRQDPAQYVLRKFETHDIVFIGERHYIKHDVEFVQSLIPRLYEKGVRNLGIEFGRYDDQNLVDQLVTAPEYDENRARSLMFQAFVLWGYKEYHDLYRAAWKLNGRLGAGKPKFRIVHLAPRFDWSQLTDNTRPRSEMLQVMPEGDSDTKAGRVILDEFVAKGQKALVYMGSNHTLTRYDYRSSAPPRMRPSLPARAGRVVYERIADRTFVIRLHSLVEQRNGGLAHPVAGVIDAVFSTKAVYPTGFDTRGTPFGILAERNCTEAAGHEPLALQDLCDGYIFIKPLNEYEMVTVDQHFIDEGNLREALAQLPDVDARKTCRSVADVTALIRAQAEYGFRGTLAPR